MSGTTPSCVHAKFSSMCSLFSWIHLGAFLSEYTAQVCLISRNWSFGKRPFTTFRPAFLHFSDYIGPVIFTPVILGLMEAFDVSLTKATLDLTLYVLGKITRSRYIRRALTCQSFVYFTWPKAAESIAESKTASVSMSP